MAATSGTIGSRRTRDGRRIMIEFLVYKSRATIEISSIDLGHISSRSRSNNWNAGLTGVLLYNSGNFLQYIEGDSELIHRAFQRICRDERHADIGIIYSGLTNSRLFPNWEMNILNLSAPCELDDAPMRELVTAFGGRESAGSRSPSQRVLGLLRTFSELGSVEIDRPETGAGSRGLAA